MNVQTITSSYDILWSRAPEVPKKRVWLVHMRKFSLFICKNTVKAYIIFAELENPGIQWLPHAYPLEVTHTHKQPSLIVFFLSPAFCCPVTQGSMSHLLELLGRIREPAFLGSRIDRGKNMIHSLKRSSLGTYRILWMDLGYPHGYTPWNNHGYVDGTTCL